MLRSRDPGHPCDAGSGWPGRAAQGEAGGGEALGGVEMLEGHLEGDRCLGQRGARRMGRRKRRRRVGKERRQGRLGVLTCASFKPKRSEFPVSSEPPPFLAVGLSPTRLARTWVVEAACQSLEIPRC